MTDFVLPEQPATWVFAGDSITQGVYHTHGARGWVEHLHERVRWQLDRLHDTVINSGVSGSRAPALLEHLDRHLVRYRPDIVSISFGTNDALAGPDGLAPFRAALESLIRASTDAGAGQLILHTPALVTAGAKARAANLPRYAELVREVAVRHGAILVDHERHWAEHFGPLEPIAWLDDHTHPNAVGHLELANHTLRVLGLGELDERA